MRRTFLAVIVLGLAYSGRAEAGPISYTESITTNGTLDGTAFTSKLVTLTLTADSSNASFFQGSGFTRYTNTINSATLTVAGIGSDTMLDSFSVAVEVFGGSNPFADFLVKDLTQSVDFFDTFTTAAALTGVDLGHAFGPASGGAALDVTDSFGTSFQANTGSFLFANVGGGVSSVSATTTPEPSSLAMTALGGAGAFLLLRERFRRRLVLS